MNSLSNEDPNLCKRTVCASSVGQVTNETSDIIMRIFSASSSWYGLKRDISWILIVFDRLRDGTRGIRTRDMSMGLSVNELEGENHTIYPATSVFNRGQLHQVKQRDSKVKSDLSFVSIYLKSWYV